jgi:hypothetical protein
MPRELVISLGKEIPLLHRLPHTFLFGHLAQRNGHLILLWEILLGGFMQVSFLGWGQRTASCDARLSVVVLGLVWLELELNRESRPLKLWPGAIIEGMTVMVLILGERKGVASGQRQNFACSEEAWLSALWTSALH